MYLFETIFRLFGTNPVSNLAPPISQLAPQSPNFSGGVPQSPMGPIGVRWGIGVYWEMHFFKEFQLENIAPPIPNRPHRPNGVWGYYT